MVWRGMTQEELDAAYNQAVYAPNLDQVLARLAANSALARNALGDPRVFRYGDADIESLHVYPAAVDNAPIHLFVHGGTWQFGSAADNAFAAETFVKAGVHFVVPDFSSVNDHDGDLSVLVDQLRRAVAWVSRHAGEFNGDPQRIFISGFSSGAHLASLLLTTDWTAMGLPADTVQGGLVSSGMYDMEPVALSFRREYVSLNDDNIGTLSAITRIDRLTAPLIVAYGTLETPEFQRQAREFAEAVAAAGKDVQLIVAQQYNHFEIIETLGNPYGILGRAALALIRRFDAP